jgi:hypothetical protein
MKSLLALMLSVTIVIFAANVISGKWAYFAKDDEKFYGTWVNTDYAGSSISQKIIYKADGTFEIFRTADSKEPNGRGRYLITGKWNDSEGNIIYKSHWVGDWSEEAYQLTRISNSGNTFESALAYVEYPTNIDLNNIWYRKYTRK